MTTTHNKIIDKIEKLLRKAEGTNNENEAAIFMAKAQELMLEHAVSEAQLSKADPSRRSRPITKRIDFGKNSTGIKAKRGLINTIAKVNRCHLWMEQGRRFLVIAGFEEDVEFVEMLYRSIELQMTAAAKSAGGGKSYLTNFMYGYVNRVAERLKEADRISRQNYQRSSGTSTTLVLADRKAEVDRLLPARMGRGAGPRHQTNYSAMADGHVAGSRADISGGRNNLGGRKAVGR